jgi:thymidylate kinase
MAAAEPQRFEIIDANRNLAEIQDNIRAVLEKRAIV